MYHIALTAGLTGWDLIRARLAGVGNKISANSADQQLSLSHLHTGGAALPRVKVFRTVLRLFGLKSDKQSALRIKNGLAGHKFISITRLSAGFSSLNSIICSVAVFYSRIFVGTVSVAKSIFKSFSFALTRMADAKSSLSRVRT